MTRITHVAVRYEGKIYSLPAPNRHHHILWLLAKEKGLPDAPEVEDADKLVVIPDSAPKAQRKSDDQGFIDDTGRYLTRGEALKIVKASGQLQAEIKGGVLTSEDLW